MVVSGISPHRRMKRARRDDLQAVWQSTVDHWEVDGEWSGQGNGWKRIKKMTEKRDEKRERRKLRRWLTARQQPSQPQANQKSQYPPGTRAEDKEQGNKKMLSLTQAQKNLNCVVDRGHSFWLQV